MRSYFFKLFKCSWLKTCALAKRCFYSFAMLLQRSMFQQPGRKMQSHLLARCNHIIFIQHLHSEAKGARRISPCVCCVVLCVCACVRPPVTLDLAFVVNVV